MRIVKFKFKKILNAMYTYTHIQIFYICKYIDKNYEVYEKQ